MPLKVISSGSFLPEKVVSNALLATTVDTSDEWIESRTGIKQRCVALPGDSCVSMAINSAKAALKRGGLHANQIDLLIVASSTPEQNFPSIACHLQYELGCRMVPAFDLQAACSGFVYALSVASSMLKADQVALIVGVEKMSDIMDWSDRNTCVLFGDGAGALLVQKLGGHSKIIKDHLLYSDGSLKDSLYTETVGSNKLTGNRVHMAGRDIFKHGVSKMQQAAQDILEVNKLTALEIDYLVPHQANKRMIDSIAQKLNLPQEKVVISIDKHANCSAASIPLAISTIPFIPRGDQLMLTVAFGAGAVWGANLLFY